MSQMLCFPSFRGVVGQPIVIAGGTASHVQVNELKMVGRLHAGSSRFDHGCDMRRWFNEIMLKTVCFCIGNLQIDFPRFRFPSDIVLTGHFDCYSYPQGARRNSLLCHSGCCGRCAQHITSVLSELVWGPSPKKHLLTKQSHHPAMDKGEWCLR